MVENWFLFICTCKLNVLQACIHENGEFFFGTEVYLPILATYLENCEVVYCIFRNHYQFKWRYNP